ncbi:hypothetical protein L5F46_02555 [Aliarcobacter butzleri]|jgi:hypothetical protein|uniref:hypothetical protein n=1 Tax=Aliarcobacter butzleri TaxID=28197 RepID=UPI001EDE5AF5|nr:hypothetical protein [Aliarcobacter butzleri]MCG3673652.1 hypothetical protein [Aliarcobacter butzleri]
MTKYLDLDNDSGIEAYEIGSNQISVKFKDTAKIYVYSYTSAGKENVEHMKKLAQSGDGLNSFINLNVKYKYVR